MEKWGSTNAFGIAKILLNCGIIEEDEFQQTVHDLMDGNLKIGVTLGKEKSKKTSKKEKVAFH